MCTLCHIFDIMLIFWSFYYKKGLYHMLLPKDTRNCYKTVKWGFFFCYWHFGIDGACENGEWHTIDSQIDHTIGIIN